MISRYYKWLHGRWPAGHVEQLPVTDETGRTSVAGLYVAGDLRGVYVSGFAFAYPLQELANDEALEQCEERRADRRIEPACRLYAVGDERVDATEP